MRTSLSWINTMKKQISICNLEFICKYVSNLIAGSLNKPVSRIVKPIRSSILSRVYRRVECRLSSAIVFFRPLR